MVGFFRAYAASETRIMTARPYRLPAGEARGRLIDRSKRLGFTFDGAAMSGYAGDTLASAVMATGQRLFGRSFKYHRPRGVVGLGAEEMNALVGVGTADRHEPNMRATQIELYQGLVAVSQNRWPSLAFDLGAISNRLSRFLPAGFYYKTFMWPPSFWKMVYEPLIRRTAGLGQAARHADPDTYEHLHVNCDVLVVGAGVAGLAAAHAAGASGVRVIIADENPNLGGMADIAGGTIEGGPPLKWTDAQSQALYAAENVHVLTRTTVVGHFHHNHVLMLERIADHDPALLATGSPRQRLWKVRARQIVLATGAIERPITFANNDRPGVMLATAARGYVERYGVAPGQRAVVFTNNDDAYRTALSLKAAGITVAGLVDARREAASPLAEEVRKAGIELWTGCAVSGVGAGFAGRSIDHVRIAPYRSGKGRIVSERKIPCDLVAVSGGFNPAVHAWCHNGGSIRFDEAIQSFRPDRHQEAMRCAGAANGTFDLAGCLAEGFTAGELAAKAVRTRTRAGKTRAAAAPETATPLEPVWFAPATGKYNEGNKHFIDLQNDVTVADLELAQREGYASVEHTKRYTTWGMATDQGKTSNINGLGIIAEATGQPIPAIGITTFRPPYTPLPFGAVAGVHTKELFLPVRRTAVFDWHVEHGADFEPVGLWRRPYRYRKGGEDRRASVNREILAVRNRVGILDASTLGKIEVKGPDAAELLDRIYTNTLSTLKVGRCRYGLMLNEMGFLIDDGVTVRIAEDHFLMHTTSGGAERVSAMLEEWLQTEWMTLRVFVTPVTEQWSQFAVAGPSARKTLEHLEGDIDFSAAGFPYMSMKTGTLSGCPVRVFRISFSGELSYELATPAGCGRALWDAVLDAGREFGIEPYGTEALHVLRAEKGFIVIGDETDGTVTPDDVGLGWAVAGKKRDFLGKRSLDQAYLRRPGRKQLVGLLTEEPMTVLPEGAHAVERVLDKPPMKTIGHVTSSYYSPTLNRSIAMALIDDGRAKLGATLSFPLEDRVVSAKVVEPVFYDREGARQNV
jgi:sarcosine oxidase subunit alpha